MHEGKSYQIEDITDTLYHFVQGFLVALAGLLKPSDAAVNGVERHTVDGVSDFVLQLPNQTMH